MRRLLLIGLTLFIAAGCAWFREPPQAGITTGATVVYNGGAGGEVFSVCDKGNLVYLTKSQPAVAIVKDGCNPQVAESNLAQVAAIRAIAERPPAAGLLPVTIPQPFLIQIVPGPGPSPFPPPQVDNTLPEPRVIVVPPPACPVCPAFPEVPPGWTPPIAPPATQLPAPAPAPRAMPAAKPKAVLVQADPNTASTEDLERLPGVTAKMAQQIARGRPYRTLQDLASKKALTDAELAALAPYLVIR